MSTVSTIVDDVVNTAAAVDPTSTGVQLAEAAVETVEAPSNPTVLLADIELAIKIITAVKQHLGSSPNGTSLWNSIKGLF